MAKRILNVVIGKYDIRGTQLGKSFMACVPSFKYMMEYAKHSQSELDVQLRGKEINIYYEGGSLLKLSGSSTLEFDENYFYQPSDNSMRMTDIERLCHPNFAVEAKKSKFLKSKTDDELSEYRNNAQDILKDIQNKRDAIISKLKNANTFGEVKKIIDDMKDVMHSWKVCLKNNGIRKDVVNERVVQHYLSLYNKDSEQGNPFIVLDLEYAISTNARYAKDIEREKQPRIDIVAIEKSTGQLYVMELKYGMKSVEGDASASKHYQDYLQTVGNDQKWPYFVSDVQKLLKAKQERGIIDNSISIKDSKPIFSFIMKCERLSDIADFKKHLKDNNLAHVPTIYLKPEQDYSSPSREGHILKF